MFDIYKLTLISILLIKVVHIVSVDINKIADAIQRNANDITKNIIGDHLGWNDNLKVYYNAFLLNKLQKYISDEPIFVYELTYTQSWSQFGNRLGHYYEVVSLCKEAGLHFIGFTREDKTKEPAGIIGDALPKVIIHSNPAKNHEEGVKRLKALVYHDWPWTVDNTATWTNLPDIAKYTRSVSNTMQNAFNPSGNELSKDTFDMMWNNRTAKSKYPYIPYAVILTRCSDLIRAGHFDEYGMLNFNVYLMIIPRDATEIYILAEPLDYGSEHGAKICKHLIENLGSFLQNHYPNSVIGVRRGHVHHAFVQLCRSKYVVCAPSTFCLWPAISNSVEGGQNVYYQPSKLVADGKQVYIHKKFHWISYPNMYSYMMSEYDEKHEVETANGLTKLLSEVRPRCENMRHIDKNEISNLQNWDCNDIKI